MPFQIIDAKEQLKEYRGELLKICTEITDNKRRMFLKDTIDIINMQIKEDYNSNDKVVCNLASMILQRL